MVIQTNLEAMRAHNAMRTFDVQQERASRRLASAYRINSAADDVAGMGISEKMRAQVVGIEMATRNCHDAISLIQVADGGMQGIHDLVHRMRELVVYAANDTHTPDSRRAIQIEIDNLMHELDQMTHRVQFNTIEVLRGTDGASGTSAPIGFSAAELAGFSAAVDSAAEAYKASFVALSPAQIESDQANKIVGVARYNVLQMFNDFLKSEALKALADVGGKAPTLVDDLKALVSSFTSSIESMETGADWSAATKNISSGLPAVSKGLQGFDAITFSSGNPDHRTAFNAVSDMFASASAANQAFGESLQLRDTAVERLETAAFLISETDKAFREALEAYSGASIDPLDLISPTSSGGSGGPSRAPHRFHFQIGPNSGHSAFLNIESIDSEILKIGYGDGRANFSVELMSGHDISQLLDHFDHAISHISVQRGKLGAMQNRLEFVIEGLGVTFENLTNARSRIMDADMPKEVMNLAKANVLSQAAQAMLAQANQAPNSVLQLLQ